MKEKKQLLQSLGLPFYLSASYKQKGLSFGEKISNSIQEVFDLGYEKIVVVGNDCPFLDIAMLRNAIDQLRVNDVVIGPDKRGGIYLLGVSKNVFCKKDIEQLPWQTPLLAAALHEYFYSAQVPTVALQRLTDVNQPSDLFLVNRFGKRSNIVLRFIHDLLGQVSYNFLLIKRPYTDLLLAHSGLRAPPLAL